MRVRTVSFEDRKAFEFHEGHEKQLRALHSSSSHCVMISNSFGAEAPHFAEITALLEIQLSLVRSLGVGPPVLA
jgi:hypothetical protein